MARYKPANYGQMKLLPVSFEKQIMPGSFEYALNQLIDERVDLTHFNTRYKNDATGASAYDPRVLMKIILYAYSKGVTSSRRIEQLCRENVMFMALSADTVPHFTTIADFVATLDKEVSKLFCEILLICDELKLIGRDMFAVDGVKLPSNASKEHSGTKEDFTKKVKKIERAIEVLTDTHRKQDQNPSEEQQDKARQKQINTLTAAANKIKTWLEKNQDKMGASGNPIKSNITDNESAKIKTSKGVIQGYDGIAVVDNKHQIVVQAAAFGEAQEKQLLQPTLEATQEQFKQLGDDNILNKVKITADAGYHTEANMHYLFKNNIDSYVADTLFRKRDPRFATADRHKPPKPDPKQYRPSDFNYNPQTHTCICPAGKTLHGNGNNCKTSGYTSIRFRGAKQDCLPCDRREKCLRDPNKTQTRQVAFFSQHTTRNPYTQQMKQRIDTDAGRYHYSKRLGTVEPVFAHICHAMGLKRFSLRGKTKVDTQWKLFCLVHNIKKIHRYGNLASLKT